MKNKLLGSILILLVLANIATLGVFWYYKIHNMPASRPMGDERRGNGNASAFIIKQVGLDAKQQAAYAELVKQHQQKVRAVRDELHLAKDDFFNLLSDSTASPQVINAASLATGKLEQRLDVLTFEHFRQVRALCTAEQKIKLDNCIKQVMRMMAPPPGVGRPPGPPPGANGNPQDMPPPSPPGEGPPPPQQ
jgi:protein CpxP